MTNEQFDEIKELLKLYRKQKATTIKKRKEEFSKHFYDAFLDYQAAFCKYTQETSLQQYPPKYYIDSLCAMAVVAINAGREGFFCHIGFYTITTHIRYIFDEIAKRGQNPYECMKKFIKEKSC